MDRPDPSDRPVLVLDFGAQYVQLIARRVRERHAFARIVRHDITPERVAELNPLALILSGGPSSVYEADAPRCDPRLFSMGIPVLGICYGMQLACEALGGKVEPAPAREFGRAECRVVDPSDPLFQGVPTTSTVWMSHGDQVRATGGSFVAVASTDTCPMAAVRHATLPVYGLQFHPEVGHTPYGPLLIGNFLDRVCHSPGSWTMDAFLDRAVEEIGRAVGPSDRVVCGLSGGVDSSVVRRPALPGRIGSQAWSCILVDNGLLRKSRANALAVISEAFRRHSSKPICTWSRTRADKLPFGALRGDHRSARKTHQRIGHAFIDVLPPTKPGQKSKEPSFLAQGTLYPDVIESGAAADGPGRDN